MAEAASSISSFVVMTDMLMRMVESRPSVPRPMAERVEETWGRLEAQADPADTYTPLSSRAWSRTSALTPGTVTLMMWGAPSLPLLPLTDTSGIFVIREIKSSRS